MHKKDIVHAYYSKESGKVQVVNKLEDDLSFYHLKYKASFENMPKAYNNEYYTIMDSFTYIQRLDSLKTILGQELWSVFEKQNGDIINLYHELQFDDNPLIMLGTLNHF